MAEPITFKCYKCKQELSVDAALSGFTVACPSCETVLNVPVVTAQAPNASRTKIKLKQELPGQLKVEAPEASTGDAEEYPEGPQEEVEYIFVDEEAPSPFKKIMLIFAGLVVLVALGVGVFFGVNAYLAHSAKVAEEKRIAQEAAEKEAALAAKEERLKPVMDDAKALAEKVRSTKTDVEHAIKVFEDLKANQVVGTKYAPVVDEELSRLKLMAEGIADERKAAQAAAQAAAAEQRRQQQQAQQQAQANAKQAQPAQPQAQAPQQPQGVSEAEKKAAQDRYNWLIGELCKDTLKGDWKDAFGKVNSFQDKGVGNALKPVFQAILDQDKLILSSLKSDEGKELQVGLKTRVETMKIVSVKGNNIQVSQKFDRAYIQKTYTDDDLSPAERMARVAKNNPEAASLMGIAYFAANQEPDDAMNAIEGMQPKSGPSSSLRDKLKKELLETLAQDEYERLLNKYRLRDTMKPEEMAVEIAKMKLLTDNAKDDYKKPIDIYQTKYKGTAYFKKVEANIAAIAKAVDALKAGKPAAPGATPTPSGNNSLGKPSLNNSVKGGLK